jgi:MFS family permease
VSLLGKDASFAALMPSFAVIGIGGGLSVPLTAMVLGAMPGEQAGVASGIFNAAREVAGLLGITVIGAVLSSRQGSALRSGVPAPQAFLDGYHAGLAVTLALIGAGIVVAMVTLRRTARPAVPPTPVPAEQVAQDLEQAAIE